VEPDRVVTSAGGVAGDVLLLSKPIAVEGTALLAREAAPALRGAGVSQQTIDRAAGLLLDPGISVVPEAEALCSAVAVHAMHDPTEGGLATGLAELAAASGLGLRVDERQIPLLPETETCCRALELDPLGLIASGSLLAALPDQEADHALRQLRTLGFAPTIIGALTPPDQGQVLLDSQGREQPLPRFPRDELARFFER